MRFPKENIAVLGDQAFHNCPINQNLNARTRVKKAEVSLKFIVNLHKKFTDEFGKREKMILCLQNVYVDY